MTKAVDDLVAKNNKEKNKIERFAEILDSLDSTEDKKKLLWKEIYENALNDRESAHVLFSDLLQQSHGNSANHAIFGPIMTKYLERMSKSNDQILRLAELISKAEQSERVIDTESVFDQIGS